MRFTHTIRQKMKFPTWLKVYGDQKKRGNCPSETAEQITFFNAIRRQYPETWGRIALHPRNEGRRTYAQAQREKSEGMTDGAPDIVIGDFFCELKRQDHTKSTWQKGQLEYLEAASDCGMFVCVALGWAAAIDAFEEYLNARPR